MLRLKQFIQIRLRRTAKTLKITHRFEYLGGNDHDVFFGGLIHDEIPLADATLTSFIPATPPDALAWNFQ